VDGAGIYILNSDEQWAELPFLSGYPKKFRQRNALTCNGYVTVRGASPLIRVVSLLSYAYILMSCVVRIFLMPSQLSSLPSSPSGRDLAKKSKIDNNDEPRPLIQLLNIS